LAHFLLGENTFLNLYREQVERAIIINNHRGVGHFCHRNNRTVVGETDLGGLGALFAFKDAPLVYGYANKPSISEWVLFWHKYLKPAAWIMTGGVVALSALHYLTVGPYKVEEPSKDKEAKNETK
jgi:hypothetical protein